WNRHLACCSKGGTGILPVAQKVEQAFCLLLKRWNRHLACCSKGGTGILPVAVFHNAVIN
ncbi:hypothetical protein QUB26_17305, partial [Microcoleus sp. B4-C1]